jgi:1,4-dihydroxy-2-naphthoate octaprenyltransferase
MLKASTLQLLRFPFSYFLMPVYFFALSFVDRVDWFRAALIFLLIHLLLYPSSNGYNSYMDRDTGSIGGIKDPMQPTKELFYVTVIMDVLAGALSFFISAWFGLAFVFYIICSRLYSYRGIRLKQYPVIGYLTVIVNQGAVIFFMVAHGASIDLTTDVSYTGMLASGFLIGGFYPITQIYQHQQDKEDGVKTISMLLGKRGTFFFCAVMYTMAFGLLFMDYMNNNALNDFLVLQAFFIPVIIFFLRWFIMVWKDEAKADFKHTMQMNWLAGTCTNLAFITIIIIHQLG